MATAKVQDKPKVIPESGKKVLRLLRDGQHVEALNELIALTIEDLLIREVPTKWSDAISLLVLLRQYKQDAPTVSSSDMDDFLGNDD